MTKFKYSAFCAAFGFMLSFIISICTAKGFGRSFVNGLIFAVVFAVLEFCCGFIFKRFLDDGASSLDLSEESEKKSAPKGSYVDIVVGDENLTQDDQGPEFNVHLDESSYIKEKYSSPEPKKEAAVQNTRTESAASVDVVEKKAESAPVSHNAEPSPQFEAVPLGSPFGGSQGSDEISVSASSGNSEIDSLPVFESQDTDGSEEIIQDSEFAREGVAEASFNHSSLVDGAQATNHDAKTLASAIRTLLKKDD